MNPERPQHGRGVPHEQGKPALRKPLMREPVMVEPGKGLKRSTETAELVYVKGVDGKDQLSHVVYSDRIEVREGKNVVEMPKFLVTGQNTHDVSKLLERAGTVGWGGGWPHMINATGSVHVAGQYARDNAVRHPDKGKEPVILVIDVAKALAPDKSGKQSARYSHSAGGGKDPTYRFHGALPPGSWHPVAVPKEPDIAWGIGGEGELRALVEEAKKKLRGV